jgi:thioredoxin 1
MKIISYLFLIATLFQLSSCGTAQNGNFNLSATDFDKKIKENLSAPLLDVRTPGEYSKGHIENSINADWNGTSFDSEIKKLDPSKPVFVYCLSGGRSSSAANKLRSSGFKEVYELNGGILKWRSANLPETTLETSFVTGMTKEHFDSMLVKDKIVLIDFYAEWCGPCKKMTPYWEEISTEFGNTVNVIRINADDNKTLMKALNIDELPTLFVYKNGALTWKHSGYESKENIVAQLQ